MAELKTQPTDGSVDDFLAGIKDEVTRQDSRALVRIMKRVTRSEPKMWGPSIVGFGSYHYRYASGREGDWMLTGFSPRKRTLTVYIMSGFAAHRTLLPKLGPHSTGASCLYIKRLEDVDLKVLTTIIKNSVAQLRKRSR